MHIFIPETGSVFKIFEIPNIIGAFVFYLTFYFIDPHVIKFNYLLIALKIILNRSQNDFYSFTERTFLKTLDCIL